MIELTKSVKQLLIINISLFLVTFLLKLNFLADFVLFPINSDYFQVHQLLTYMFLHSSITHIIFNMIGLIVFGPEIEQRLGKNKFINTYLLSGVIAGIFHIMFINNPVVGASGAIWCLMAMYALYNPERIFNIYFIIPAKIKYIVGIYFTIEVILAFIANDGVSHIAHIGGAMTGFIVYLLDKKKNILY